jgi:predicted flap endonuclease-1-like 5' DNA nuclease
MIWAMIEVVLPMFLTFLFGLLTGWLWWRQRRVDQRGLYESADSDVHGVSTPSASESSPTEATVASDSESAAVPHQLPHKRSLHEQALAKELTSANASIRSLVSELEFTRDRLKDCESQLAASSNVSTPAAANGVIHVAAGSESEAAAEPVVADAGDDASSVTHDSVDPVSAERVSAELVYARNQLKSLQQRYQELETSHSIDRAELAKNQHLEVRLNNLTRELTENKSELAAAKKEAVRLQAEVQGLKSDSAQQRHVGLTQNRHADSMSSESGDCPSGLTELQARLAEVAPVAERARAYQSQVAVLKANLEQSESRLRQLEASGQRIDQLDSQLQTRLADELEKSQQQVATLEQKASLTAEKSAELVRTRSRVATLETELGEANSRAEDADRLRRRVSELEVMLKGSEVKAVNERLVEAEAQLRIATNRVNDQQLQIQRLQKKAFDSSGTGVNSVAGGSDAAATQAELVRRQGSVTAADTGSVTPELKGQYAQDRQPNAPDEVTESAPAGSAAGSNSDQADAAANDADNSDGASATTAADTVTGDTARDTGTNTAASREPLAWQSGETRFGTPAASHKDDLKVIRGIGPVLERTLNDAEIQSWDQLAALTADEVSLIEKSIDFPGRMTREQWVEQATELVALYPDPDNRPSGRNLLPKKS